METRTIPMKFLSKSISTVLAAGIMLLNLNCLTVEPEVDDEELSIEAMKQLFTNPSEDNKPWTYWYWINNQISKEGITKDLESMSKLGIGTALIGNIYLDELERDSSEIRDMQIKTVDMLGEDWLELTKHAIMEGGRLGVDIGLFNSPGWSQSGGPWNRPENSMRFLKTINTSVSGEGKKEVRLKQPDGYFETIAVLAVPEKIPREIPSPVDLGAIKNLTSPEHLFDNNNTTVAEFFGNGTSTISFDYKEYVDVHGFEFYPNRSTFKANCKIYFQIESAWKLVKEFAIDRSNDMDMLGFDDYPPVAVSLPGIKTTKVKLLFENIEVIGDRKSGLSEIKVLSRPVLEYYPEKSLAKMHQTPLPLEDAYTWPSQKEPKDSSFLIDKNEIIDLTDNVDSNQILHWDMPKGNWNILQIGMTSTGITNNPAAHNAKGLEVDKLNRKQLQHHFDAYVGRILQSMAAEDRKALKYVIADSYETGAQNWTDDFHSLFKDKMGYDPIPWLPVLTGNIINSADESNRFLWDLRRLVADQIAYEYVGGLQEICNENNLELWLENYGHWGYPSEFLLYGGQADRVGGEFWAEGDLGSIECKAASSAAHTYGKKIVSAESYTAAFKHYERHPGALKKRGDWSFTQGINHVVLHVYIHQPYPDRYPGVNAWFGTEFNRNNTWFDRSKPWMDYLRRCQFMLQQGLYVADIAYYIGEDTPKMTGSAYPELPDGYSFDYINSDVLLNDITIKNGRFTLPDGMSYKILVLPDDTTMRPKVLRKIESLVAQGGVIMGMAPSYSPSKKDYPNADTTIQQMAQTLWAINDPTDNHSKLPIKYGAGYLFPYTDMDDLLSKLDTPPDIIVDQETPILWTHRSDGNRHVYFITNQSDDTIKLEPSFRVSNLFPSFWDPVSGDVRSLPKFTQNNGYTQVPIHLSPQQSSFVVFTKEKPSFTDKAITTTNPSFETNININGNWKISFPNVLTGDTISIVEEHLKDWTEYTDETIKYFSGTARYTTNFEVNKVSNLKEYYLKIGKADVIANVKLNGHHVGGLWTPPWTLDITGFLKEGTNLLEIEVSNLWKNQLIYQSKLPRNQRKTWSFVKDVVKETDSLSPSGLKGPIQILSY